MAVWAFHQRSGLALTVREAQLQVHQGCTRPRLAQEPWGSITVNRDSELFQVDHPSLSAVDQSISADQPEHLSLLRHRQSSARPFISGWVGLLHRASSRLAVRHSRAEAV